MKTNHYLDQFAYLTPEQRDALKQAGYDDTDSFLGTTQDNLIKIGVPAGHAAKLIRFAQQQDTASFVGAMHEHLQALGGPRHASAAKALRRRQRR